MVCDPAADFAQVRDELSSSDLGVVSRVKRAYNRVRAVLARADRYARAVSDAHVAAAVRSIRDRLDTPNAILHAHRQLSTRARASAALRVPEWWLRRDPRRDRWSCALRRRGRELSRARARADLVFRIRMAAAERPGWFPIFATLTVRGDSYDEVFSNGKAWSLYARSVRRAVGAHVYGSVAAAERHDAREYAVHFGVVERGTLGRYHLHALWLVRDLPPGWRTDPSRHPTDVRTEIGACKALWPHGHSTHVAVRCGRSDPYGRLGWSWPWLQVGERRVPREASEIGALASYVAKYLGKDGVEWQTARDRFRTRMTQGAGLQLLRTALASSPGSLAEVVRNPERLRSRLPRSCRPSARLLRENALRLMSPASRSVTESGLLERPPVRRQRLSWQQSSVALVTFTRASSGRRPGPADVSDSSVERWTVVLEEARRRSRCSAGDALARLAPQLWEVSAHRGLSP